MRKVLFDTNIIIDIALEREPFIKNSLKAIHLVGSEIIGYINVLTLVNTFYYARKKVGIELAKEFINNLLNHFEVVNISKITCIDALRSNFTDFEDAVQEFSAVDSDIQIIVTRNIKDFKHSNLKVVEPKELIEMFS